MCLSGPLNGRLKGIGEENGGLYIFRSNKEVPKNKVPENQSSLIAVVPTQGGSLWHRRLGHSSIQVMKNLNLLQNKYDADMLDNCTVCPLAKQVRLSFPTSNFRSG